MSFEDQGDQSLEDQSPEDQVVLITGAGSGMGRLAAQRMCQGGARVVGADVNEEGLRETGRDLERCRHECDPPVVSARSAAMPWTSAVQWWASPR